MLCKETAVRYEDTNELADARLTPRDGVRFLIRIHRFLLLAYLVGDEFDLVARLDAERDCIRLRNAICRELRPLFRYSAATARVYDTGHLV